MIDKVLGHAGDRVVIEECLTGQEVSLMVIADGSDFVPMLPCQDHKAAYDGDQGPNTGGMGCYAPVPMFTPELVSTAIEQVIKPTLAGMAEEGNPFSGVLYAGLMVSGEKTSVLEYNCRFGDPETQVVLPLMEADLADVLCKAADSALAGVEVGWSDGAAVCVVMASGGYPGPYQKGLLIDGIENAAATGAIVFHAGTSMSDGQTVTAGGRVLGVTATGVDHASAMAHAYAAVKKIDFDGAHYRRDIGRRAV
jgi:phosphoribosylamine--glycine ligase